MINIKTINFFPQNDINSKGFLGIFNVVLEIDGELLSLNSCSAYSRLNEKGGVRILNPAKKVGAGYKFYFVLPPRLQALVEEAVSKELERIGLWDFKKQNE